MGTPQGEPITFDQLPILRQIIEKFVANKLEQGLKPIIERLEKLEEESKLTNERLEKLEQAIKKLTHVSEPVTEEATTEVPEAEPVTAVEEPPTTPKPRKVRTDRPLPPV